MTNAEKIIQDVRSFVEEIEHGLLPELLLQLARNADLDPEGELYRLWCDNCGDCAQEGDDCCTDEAHLCCIRRYLSREYEPKE